MKNTNIDEIEDSDEIKLVFIGWMSFNLLMIIILFLIYNLI